MYHSCKNIVGLLFMLICVTSVAQTEENSHTAVDRSYALYLKKDWKTLISNSDSTLQQGTDYYFLRVRRGVAKFELKQYLVAEEEFKKAIAFNDFEELPKEYLYYTYVYTARKEHARKLAKGFSSELQNKIGLLTEKKVDVFEFGGGGKFSNLSDVPSASLFDIGLSHKLLSSASMDHRYSRYNQSNTNWEFHQNEYYGQLNIPFKKNILGHVAYHYVGSSFTYLASPFVIEPTELNVHAVSVYVQKQIKKHEIGIGSSLIDWDENSQVQHDFSYSYFPKANKSLFFGAKAYVHSSDSYATSYVSVLPFVSFTPSLKWNVFASYLYNKGNNIAEWNASLVNNSPDLTTGRLSCTLDYYANPNWTLSFTYQNENKESDITSNYNFNSLFFTLKFKPL